MSTSNFVNFEKFFSEGIKKREKKLLKDDFSISDILNMTFKQKSSDNKLQVLITKNWSFKHNTLYNPYHKQISKIGSTSDQKDNINSNVFSDNPNKKNKKKAEKIKSREDILTGEIFIEKECKLNLSMKVYPNTPKINAFLKLTGLPNSIQKLKADLHIESNSNLFIARLNQSYHGSKIKTDKSLIYAYDYMKDFDYGENTKLPLEWQTEQIIKIREKPEELVFNNLIRIGKWSTYQYGLASRKIFKFNTMSFDFERLAVFYLSKYQGFSLTYKKKLFEKKNHPNQQKFIFSGFYSLSKDIRLGMKVTKIEKDMKLRYKFALEKDLNKYSSLKLRINDKIDIAGVLEYSFTDRIRMILGFSCNLKTIMQDEKSPFGLKLNFMF